MRSANLRQGILVLILLFVTLPALAVECPLVEGDNVFLIDTVGTAPQYETATACLNEQPADCGLIGVLTLINEIIPQACVDELNNGDFKDSTIALGFAPEMAETPAPALPLTIYAPEGLGHLVVDGILSENNRYELRGDGSGNFSSNSLRIECSNDPCTTHGMPNIAVRNLNVSQSYIGLAIDGRGTPDTRVILENITANTLGNSVGGGVLVYSIYDSSLSLKNVSVQGSAESAVLLASSSLSGGAINGLHIDGAQSGLSMVFMDSSVGGYRYPIHNFTATNVSTGISLAESKLSNLNIINPQIDFSSHGISHIRGIYDENIAGLLIVDAKLTGDGSPGSTAIRIEDKHAMFRTSGVQIQSSSDDQMIIDRVEQGVNIVGNVRTVRVEGVQFSNIGSSSVSASANAVGRAPDKILVTEMRSDAPTPIELVADDPLTYKDIVLNTASPNDGVDTPPLNYYKPTTLRDWNQPTEAKISIRYYANAEPRLYLMHGNLVEDLNIDPQDITTTECHDVAIPWCMYEITVDFADYGIDAESMEHTTARVGFAFNNNSSALSAPIYIADADFVGTKVLHVDTNIDDIKYNECLDSIKNDCSLRGAIAHATHLRQQGHHHPVKLILDAPAPHFVLNTPLELTTHSITIVGAGPERSVLIAGDELIKTSNDVFIKLSHNYARLRDLRIEGRESFKYLVDTNALVTPIPGLNDPEYSVQLRNIHFSGIAEDTAVINAPTSLDAIHLHVVGLHNITLHDAPESSILASLAFHEQGPIRFAHVTNLHIRGETLPTNLLPGVEQASPVLAQSITPHWENFSFDLVGQATGGFHPSQVDVYAGFSKRPHVRLEHLGTYPVEFFGPDNNVFSLTTELPSYLVNGSALQELPNWGTIQFWLVGQSTLPTDDSALTTMGSTLPTTLNQALADLDPDGDGHLFAQDNCPTVANTTLLDTDGDGEGDACDLDDDNDGTPDALDNCPLLVTANMLDNDIDGLGDACDPDDDNDTIPDTDDSCPFDANTDQATMIVLQDSSCVPDGDKDSMQDSLDNCPHTANADQLNYDGDEYGDACDDDRDNDTINNAMDNCELLANPEQIDTDEDGLGDLCDDDADGDHVLNLDDNCPLKANEDQADQDANGVGDACDVVIVTPITTPTTPGSGGTGTPTTGTPSGSPGEPTGPTPEGPEGPAATDGGGCGCRLAAEHAVQKR